MNRRASKLLLVHQAFVGPGEAGGTRHLELARHLIAAGWQVTVIASPLSYLTGRAAPAAPNVEPGLTIRRARVFRRLFGHPITRVVNFLSFAASAGALAWREPDIDAVWATSPPLFQALATALIARLRGCPLIVEIRDLWPDMAVEMGMIRCRPVIALARLAECWLYRQADRVVINSPGYRDHIEQRGVDPERIVEIPNGVETRQFDRPVDPGAVRRDWGLDPSAFVALYAGALGRANDLGQILDAADRLRDHLEIVFVLVGDGSARADLEAEARRRGLGQVRFIDPQPKDRMPETLAAADLCLATLLPIPLFATTYPNKVFDYLAAGKPIVLTIDGPIRQVVEAAGAGRYAPAGAADELAQAILDYARDQAGAGRAGENGRAYVRAHFDRAAQGQQLIDLVNSLLPTGPYHRLSRVKCALDLVLAVAGLMLSAPIFLVAAIAIKATSPGPVFYVSERIGQGGRPFRLLKFRTMIMGAETKGLGLRVAADDDRITPPGRWLRRTSLDELPQLWNVVRREMSLVGPRPTIPSQVARYTPDQRRRLAVRPGLTGWAQVNGRNGLTWEERIALDIWYIDHWSLRLDLRILARTPGVLLSGQGLYGPGGVTLDLGEAR
ncbi:MAG TPA: sugar transferase [Dehalococcoidia bacterium]|nr:sugar transferase [Dehalococcoidia bacterium]